MNDVNLNKNFRRYLMFIHHYHDYIKHIHVHVLIIEN